MHQVLVVAGGRNSGALSSTEIHVVGTASWKLVTVTIIATPLYHRITIYQVGELPSARYALRGASLGSGVYMSGGSDGGGVYSAILRYRAATEDWERVGDMETPRYWCYGVE